MKKLKKYRVYYEHYDYGEDTRDIEAPDLEQANDWFKSLVDVSELSGWKIKEITKSNE